MFQIICEELEQKGFGIEYWRLRFVGSTLYKKEQALKEIECMKKLKTFEKCRFKLNEVHQVKGDINNED